MARLKDEELLDYYFSLPDNEEFSEEEGGDEAADELACLDVSETTSVDTPPLMVLSKPHNDDRRNNCNSAEMEVAGNEVITCVEKGNVAELSSETENEVIVYAEQENGAEPANETETEWSDDVTYFEKLSASLDASADTKFDFELNNKEVDYFVTVFTPDCLEKIKDETNLYAAQMREKIIRGERVRQASCNWKDTDVEEIKCFIAIRILMGIHRLPELSHYWSTDPILGVSAVSQLMSRTRFKKLTENIHCNDNTKAVPRGEAGYDRLHKLRPIIDALNNHLKEVSTPSSIMAVDESMVPFKGRSSIKQYLPMKPVKRGYKIWCLADSKTGFINHFEVYTGKKDTQDSSFSLGENVVLKLTESYMQSHRLIVFDNFFTSYNLMKLLTERGLFGVGTVRKNRKGLPDMMNKQDKLQRGQFMFKTKGCVSAIKWQDNKTVTILSNYHSPKDVTFVNRRNKDGSSSEIFCPVAVAQYNTFMGGVDRFDQLRERYAIGRQSLKWWHRLFFFIIDLEIVNSFIMWNCNHGGGRNQLSFRLLLIRQLTAGREIKRRGRPNFLTRNKPGVKSVPDEIRLQAGKHFPVRATRKRCRRK